MSRRNRLLAPTSPLPPTSDTFWYNSSSYLSDILLFESPQAYFLKFWSLVILVPFLPEFKWSYFALGKILHTMFKLSKYVWWEGVGDSFRANSLAKLLGKLKFENVSNSSSLTFRLYPPYFEDNNPSIIPSNHLGRCHFKMQYFSSF